MPRVPRYGEPTVGAAPLPTVRAPETPPLAAFGGGEAALAPFAQARAAGQDVARIMEEEALKGDQLRVLEADAALSALETRLLYDPKEGALNRRGKDAFGAPESVMGEFGKQVSEIERGLGNDRQKLAFRRSVLARQGDIDRALQRHVAVERRRYDDEETEGFLATEFNAAVQAAGDRQRVEVALGRQMGAIVDHARRNGLPEEWVEAEIAKAQTRTHSAVIDRLLAQGQDLAAKEYFDFYKSELGAAVGRAEEALEVGSIRGESQRIVDGIFSTDYRELFDEKGEFQGVEAHHPPTTLEAALEEARKSTKDPKLRDAVEARVKDRWREMRASEQDAHQRLLDDVTDRLEKTGRVDSIPPDMWNDLRVTERKAFEARARQLQLGVEPVTDERLFTEFMGLSQEETARISPGQLHSAFRSRMSNQHWNRIVEEWNQARRAAENPAASREWASTFSDRQMILNEAVRVGLAGLKATDTWASVKKDDAKAKAMLLFEDELNLETRKFHHETGKKAGDKEKLEILKRISSNHAQLTFTRELALPLQILTLGLAVQRKSKKIAELDRADLDDGVLEMPEETQARIYNLAKSVPGLMPQNMTQDAFARLLRPRLNMAYIASLQGSDDARLLEILKGNVVWPW